MKKAFNLTAIFLLFFATAFSQKVPQGMKYQAVARTLTGNVIANQEIALKISLVNSGKTSAVYYSEVHTVTTNQLGLFSLVIGEGKNEKGTFTAVPWSTDDIWMEVSIKDKSSSLFTIISNSKLLAVPYAFHAGTASQLVNAKGSKELSLGATSTTSTTSTAAPAGTWLTAGNLKQDPSSNFIGNYDAVDLLIKTSNKERIRILANGDVKINSVSGTTDIKGATNLQSTLDVSGATTLKSTLAVTNGSATSLSGALTVVGATSLNNKVDITGITTSSNNSPSTATNNGALVITGGVGIGQNLNVGGATDITGAANLQNTLDVTGATHLKGAVNADGITTITNTTASGTSANGALVVAGGVGIGGDLNVAGATKFGSVGVSSTISAKGLTITDATTSYLATFQNTYDGEGDGIK